MLFSKSFGYAIRALLYIATKSDEKKRVQIDEIAAALKVPRFFLGKIMQEIAREGILDSTKGPYGGFSLNERSLATSVMKIVKLTDGGGQFNNCILQLKKCNPDKPCSLHAKIEKNRAEFFRIFTDTTIGDLLNIDANALVENFSSL